MAKLELYTISRRLTDSVYPVSAIILNQLTISTVFQQFLCFLAYNGFQMGGTSLNGQGMTQRH